MNTPETYLPNSMENSVISKVPRAMEAPLVPWSILAAVSFPTYSRCRYSNTRTVRYSPAENPQKIYTSPTLPTTTTIAVLHQQSSTSPTSSASNSSTTVSSPTPSPKPATSSFCQIYSEEIPSLPTPSRTLPPTST